MRRDKREGTRREDWKGGIKRGEESIGAERRGEKMSGERERRGEARTGKDR